MSTLLNTVDPQKVCYEKTVFVAADCWVAQLQLNLIIRKDNAAGLSQDEKLTGHIRGPPGEINEPLKSAEIRSVKTPRAQTDPVAKSLCSGQHRRGI